MSARPAMAETPEAVSPYILLIEDHPMMASSVQACLLAMRPQALSIVATTVAQAQAVTVKRGMPRLIITDLNLPDSRGVATISAVTDMAPGTTVIVFSALDDEATAQAARLAGASGVVTKSSIANNFAGEMHHWLEVCGPWQVTLDAAGTPATGAQDEDPLSALSQRQRKVLALMSQGYSNPEIAGQLHITRATVCTHVAEILQKLQVKNRTQAGARYMAWAHEHGIAS